MYILVFILVRVQTASYPIVGDEGVWSFMFWLMLMMLV